MESLVERASRASLLTILNELEKAGLYTPAQASLAPPSHVGRANEEILRANRVLA